MSGLKIIDVCGISFDWNQKVKFLPVKVYKKFPNLAIYSAVGASITEISASNFEKLSSLEVLNLYNNQIKSIPDDCFQGLTKLYKINLGKVKLEF